LRPSRSDQAARYRERPVWQISKYIIGSWSCAVGPANAPNCSRLGELWDQLCEKS
jgi:hypothetical protein